MSNRIKTTALAYIGLIVGAGFATGQEVIQYFLSFGEMGLWGAVIAGVLMTGGGLVVLQLGSYFFAQDHSHVFQSITQKWVAWFLDIATTITLFALGFVMLAGAGSTLNQQYGWSLWIGSTVMTVLVLLTGLMDVDKVTDIIGKITYLLIILVIVAFIYAMTQLPVDMSAMDALAKQQEHPISNWWLSAINYAGLVMIMGVSMILVMGGNVGSPREAGWGGFAGGLAYTILLIMLTVSLFITFDEVGSADVPTLKMFGAISPIVANFAVWIVYLMIYNTAIGMFYAMGRRVSASRPEKFFPIFAVCTLVGFAISFFGFSSLMSVVYPILGYLGLVLTVVMVVAYLRQRPSISAEDERRIAIRALIYKQQHPEKIFTQKDAKKMHKLYEESDADQDDVREALSKEVVDKLDSDSDVDYKAPENLDKVGVPPTGQELKDLPADEKNIK